MRLLLKFLLIPVIAGIFLYLPQFSINAQKPPEEKMVFNRYAEKYDMRPVVFTHELHSNRNKCDVCHNSIFIKKRGANDINMNKNSKGQYCGKCHNGTTAYPLLKCERCHSGATTIKK